MKKALPILVVLLSCNSLASGIPTVDAAAIAQQKAEYLEQATRWAETIKQYQNKYDMMKNQYDTAVNQLNKISGIRDIGAALDMAMLYFGTSEQISGYLSNPDRILNAGFDSLTPELRQKVDELGFKNVCGSYQQNATNDSYKVKQQKACEGRVVINLLEAELYKEKKNQREKEDIRINDLMTRIQNSQDIKESADLLNKLQSEALMLQMNSNRATEDYRSSQQAKELQQLKSIDAFKQEQRKYSTRTMKW